MNLLYIIAFISLQFMCFIIISPESKKFTLLKHILVAGTIFNIEYFFLAVIFLWCDIFSVAYILLIIFLINLEIIIFRFKTIKASVISQPIKVVNSDLIIIALLLLILPMTFAKSEDIRTSSDMGMYFSKLTVLLNENTSTVRQLSEMGEISFQADEGVLSLQEQLVGINIRGVGENGYLEYDYHSMPTWVSLMALFAEMFGIFHSTQVLSYLYILSVLTCYFICEKIGNTKNSKFLAVVLFALCPVTLYVSKCTLTEIAYVQLLLSGILLMITKNNKYFSVISGICFGLLGFIHFSTYIYWPGLYTCLFLLMLLSGNKIYGIINLIQTGFFVISVFYAHDISYAYMKSQLTDRLWFISRNLKVLVIIISAACLLALLMQLGLYWANFKIQSTLKKVTLKCLPVFLMLMIAAILIGSVLNGYNLGFTDKLSIGEGSWTQREYYLNQGLLSLNHLNIVNIMKANGWVCIPTIFVYLFVRKNKKNIIQNIIAFALLYTYASIDTPTNYYASRYYVSVIIPMITLFMATIVKPTWFYRLITAWCIVYSLRYDYVMIYRSSFMGQYNLWNDVCENIPFGSVVLANENSQQLNVITINNLRELHNCKVFNYNNEREVTEHYHKKDIYIISDTIINNSEYQLLLCKNYKIMGNLGAANAGYMIEEMNYYEYPMFIYIKNK